jgi:hypothetical protein
MVSISDFPRWLRLCMAPVLRGRVEARAFTPSMELGACVRVNLHDGLNLSGFFQHGLARRRSPS